MIAVNVEQLSPGTIVESPIPELSRQGISGNMIGYSLESGEIIVREYDYQLIE
jgi:hypothetical protein